MCIRKTAAQEVRHSLDLHLLATLVLEKDSFIIPNCQLCTWYELDIFQMKSKGKNWVMSSVLGNTLGKRVRWQPQMSPLGPGGNKQWDINTKLKLIQLHYRVILVSRSPFKDCAFGLKVTSSKVSLQSSHFQAPLKILSLGSVHP